MATCVECGAELQGQRRVVCGERCAAKRKLEKKRRGAIEMKRCQYCGASFRPTNNCQKICGNPACDKKRRLENCRELRKRNKRAVEITGIDLDKPINPMRKCHDCGEPTYNYRCDKCRAKWRAAYDVVEGRTGLDQMYGGAA